MTDAAKSPEKTPGQIAYDGYWSYLEHKRSWSKCHPTTRPQWELAAEAVRAPLVQRIAELEAALSRIAKWHGEFPETGRHWENGSPMSYGAAFGSNGERDFMRIIAREALK